MSPEVVGLIGLTIVIAAVVYVLWRLPPREGRTREDVHAMGFILGIACSVALIGGIVVFLFAVALLSNMLGATAESPALGTMAVGLALGVTAVFVAGGAGVTWKLLVAYYAKTGAPDSGEDAP